MSDASRPSAAAIFEAALDLPPDAREDFVVAAAKGDASLVVEVMALLAADDEADAYLEGEAHLAPPLEDDDDARHPDLGRDLGPFRLERVLGRGGMGTVFLARRTAGDFDQRVAVKILRRGMDTDDLLARFRRERRLLARLDHPNIARVIDGGSTDDGRPWLAMEYVEGRPIDVHAREEGLDPRRRIRLFLDVCTAVQHAHRNLVVHRDLKPGNVQVALDGTVKLLDFGIAKVIDPDDADTDVTATHVRLLSPRYGSPEQMRGEPVGTASDVYSLGVVLYELLTERSPYADPTTGELEDIERRVLREEPVAPSTAVTREASRDTRPGIDTEALRRSLRGDLDTIVLKALRKEPERRYTSVDEFAEDLRRHLDGRPVLARPDALGYRTRKFVRRNALAVGATAVVAVALIAATAISSTLFVRAQRAQRVAEVERATAESVADYLRDMMGSIGPSVAQGDDTALVRRLLADAGERIDDELVDRPDVAASLHHTLGRAYLDLVELASAEYHLSRAIELEPGGDVGRAVDFGAFLVEAGRYEQAREHLTATITRADAAGDTTSAARARSQRAQALDSLQEIDAALADFRAADRLLARTDAVAQRISVLGAFAIHLTYTHQEYPAADSLLAVARDLVDAHDSGAMARANTWQLSGTVKRRLREYAAADSFYARAHEGYLEILDPEHAQIASLQDVWAGSLEEQERYDEAIALYREALETARRVYGPEHKQTGTFANNLANCLRKAGRYDEAAPLFDEAVAAYEAALGDDHVWVAIILGNVATNHRARGQLDAALAVATRCLDLRARYWPADHWRVATARALRGAVRSERGNHDAGERDLLEALPQLEAGLGADADAVRATLEDLRAHYARSGRTPPAELAARLD